MHPPCLVQAERIGRVQRLASDAVHGVGSGVARPVHWWVWGGEGRGLQAHPRPQPVAIRLTWWGRPRRSCALGLDGAMPIM